MEKQAIVYKITCIPNSRIYIGATTQKFSARINAHKLVPNKKMAPDIKKYSWESFKAEIVYKGTEYKCFEEKEIELIAKLNPYYNTAKGGQGGGGGGAKGEENGCSILKNEDILDIRKKFNTSKYTRNDLAEEYNVKSNTIYDIVMGITWKHIDGPLAKYKQRDSKRKALKIRKEYATGKYTQKELSNLYEIKQTVISNIILGKVWKDIGGPIKGIDY